MSERTKTWLPSWFWRWIVPGMTCLGVLLLAPRLVSRFYRTHCEAAMADVDSIVQALYEYAITHSGEFPSSLQPLVTPDTNGNAYLEGFNGKLPKDPWKHDYQYQRPTPEHPKPHVWTFGADGKLGGKGDDADIDSDQLRER